MSEHIERLRAFRQYKDSFATDELKDALALLDDYDALAARLAEAQREMHDLHYECEAKGERLAEAVECCTIKDNRNLWLEIRLKKIMARCADLLDEDQFNELDAIARATDSASAINEDKA